MFKRFILFLLSLSLYCPHVLADDLTMTSFFPAPVGKYDDLRAKAFTLTPLNVAPPACDVAHEGAMYYSQSGNAAWFCNGADWKLLNGDVWLQASNSIYPRDTDTNANLKLGIGTKTPAAPVHVALAAPGAITGLSAGTGVIVQNDGGEVAVAIISKSLGGVSRLALGHKDSPADGGIKYEIDTNAMTFVTNKVPAMALNAQGSLAVVKDVVVGQNAIATAQISGASILGANVLLDASGLGASAGNTADVSFETYEETTVPNCGTQCKCPANKFMTGEKGSSASIYCAKMRLNVGVVVVPFCGDGSCNGTDTCSNCPGDCGACPAVCGDASCNGTEDASNCPSDCAPDPCQGKPKGYQLPEGALCAGIYASNHFMVTPSGCTDSATPTCAGGMDTVRRKWGAAGISTGANTISGGINTTRILAADPTAPAALFCENMNFAGYTDWHLPAIGVWTDVLLWVNATIGGFVSTYDPGDGPHAAYYWSSTESTADWAKSFGFFHHDTYDGWKTDKDYYYVRCVRTYDCM